MVTFEKILQKVLAYRPDFNRERLIRAYEYAKSFHEGERRQSGDTYISHVIEVVKILLSLKPDEDTIVAALLHGLANHDYNAEEVKRLFGENVDFLIRALKSMRRLKTNDQLAQSENLRRMFVTMAKDLRVILLKMADRLHNMRTIRFYSVSQQKQIARETLDVYVPIAARLGIYRLKSQLEDTAFECLNPKQYEHLKTDLNEYLSHRQQSIEDIMKVLRKFLEENGITGTVEGRVKNLYSIYQKLKAKSHTTLSDIYDVYAMRIVVPTRYDAQGTEVNDQLYTLLGLIHSRWRPLADRFKDYIAVPKPNGYQSLHTSVIGLSPKASQATEIQIRSQRMHGEAEFGVASHWIYEDTRKSSGKRKSLYSVDNLAGDSSPIKKYVDWLQSLSRYRADQKNGREIIEALKIEMFSDRIFVMTPLGEIKELPQGATPVDFAYAIHTDIGHRCQLAKVNGAVVPLDYELKNGDIVEINQGKNPAPKPLWLSFVKTSSAKAKIRAFFRSLDKERSFREGKDAINNYLEKIKKPLLDDTLSIFRHYNGKRLSYKDRVGLVEEIGNGSVLVAPVIKKIFGTSLETAERRHQLLKRKKGDPGLPRKKTSAVAKPDEVSILGEPGLPYRYAHCCKPSPGLPITGYINRQHSVIIHLQSCKHLVHASPERILDAAWSSDKPARKYSVKLLLKAKDRVGLIRDIADVITQMNMNIIFFSDLGKRDELIHREIVLEISDRDEYAELVKRLERVRNMVKVSRTDE